MIRRLALLSGMALSTIFASAQNEKVQMGRIETDRPDQTETPILVPRNYFQGEFGFNKENYKKGAGYSLIHPTSLLKYGLTNRFELRLEANLRSDYLNDIPQAEKYTVLDPIELGFKLALFDEKGALPQTSLITHVGMPFLGGAKGRPSHLVPSFRFTMQNTLSEKAALGYNVGAEWDGITSSPAWLYTFAPGFNVGKNWYAYVEAFGFIRKNEMPDHNMDAGIAYFISDNLKADLSAGVGLSPNSLRNYVAVGFSFRTPF